MIFFHWVSHAIETVLISWQFHKTAHLFLPVLLVWIVYCQQNYNMQYTPPFGYETACDLHVINWLSCMTDLGDRWINPCKCMIKFFSNTIIQKSMLSCVYFLLYFVILRNQNIVCWVNFTWFLPFSCFLVADYVCQLIFEWVCKGERIFICQARISLVLKGYRSIVSIIQEKNINLP